MPNFFENIVTNVRKGFNRQNREQGDVKGGDPNVDDKKKAPYPDAASGAKFSRVYTLKGVVSKNKPMKTRKL